MPSEVKNITFTDVAPTSCSLQWECPKDSDLPIDEYIIKQVASDDDKVVNVHISNKTTAIVTNLKKDGYYQFQVVAISAEGKGPPSQPIVLNARCSKINIHSLFIHNIKPSSLTHSFTMFI